jgi:hypothetical protein
MKMAQNMLSLVASFHGLSVIVMSLKVQNWWLSESVRFKLTGKAFPEQSYFRLLSEPDFQTGMADPTLLNFHCRY